MKMILRTALAARAAIASPIRRAKLSKLAAEGRAPVSVLFYHRVSNDHPNDWTISRDEFRRHVDYCARHLELIDLAEVQRRVASNDSRSPAVAFTFDDGYAENCDFALPLLIERKVPCTYFVTIDHVSSRQPFLHDVQAGRPLPINTRQQLREVADAGIEIGCHSRTHIDFSQVREPDILRREIIDAKDELEQMIGKPVRYFAFPYGLQPQLTQEAIEVVHTAGFTGFCSAFGGYNVPGRDAFHIRRFHGDPEFSRLINWLSFDAGKLRSEPTVSYRLSSENINRPVEENRSVATHLFVPDLPNGNAQANESCR